MLLHTYWLRGGLLRAAQRAPAHRSLASFQTSDPVAEDRVRAVAFVAARGNEPEVAEAVVQALSGPEWGCKKAGLLDLATRLAGRWEVDEDEGLKPLALAIRQQLAEKAGKRLVSFGVHALGGGRFEVEGLEGMTLKEVVDHGDGYGADVLGEYLECACNGVMACSTCQVYVADEWLEKVGRPSDDEEDMLELAYERRESSRLGCQLVLAKELQGMQIEIPVGANNMFDHIPFE